MVMNAQTTEFFISFDKSLIDAKFTYEYMNKNMYWAKALTYEQFLVALTHSALCAGVYVMDNSNGDPSHTPRQIGFARIISDQATFAYLTDVFIEESYRGLGLSKMLMQEIIQHPNLQGLRRFLLVTEDAEGLYAKFGFKKLADPEHWMQIFQSEV